MEDAVITRGDSTRPDSQGFVWDELRKEGEETFFNDVMGYKSKARLVLEDGRQFNGFSFGAEISVAGEVVFNTGMVGYPESFTDPSYKGQVLCITYPLVGNYGVPEAVADKCGVTSNFESDKIQVTGVIIANYSRFPSHRDSVKSLAQWLKENGVPGICGIDTRALTKYIRINGSMLGKILIGDAIPESVDWVDPNTGNLVAQVSNPIVRQYTSQFPNQVAEVPRDPDKTRKIIVVDCGIKANIIRHLIYSVEHLITIQVVPWDYPFGDAEMDGLFLTNGPGDPIKCNITIDNLKKVMQRGSIPIFGICLGNQLLALACGAKTYKMKFGNRGMNVPVVNTTTGTCYITPQNHGYAVDPESLPNNWRQYFINANDRSNEGILHVTQPWFSVQFHPEASGGPTDTWFLFTHFLRKVTGCQRQVVDFVPLHLPIQRRKVLILGSGGLTIGQAGEFDYSGSQAIKAIKEMNVETVLINPNIATVQTSDGLADRVYFLPVNEVFVTQVIKKERPDGLLCTFGGQTALNVAVKLHHSKVLDRYECAVLGTQISVIEATENREKFAAELQRIGERCAQSIPARSTDEALSAADVIGYPVLVRAAYTLGGLGSGFANNQTELIKLCDEALNHTDQLLIDKSLVGWKEIEYEVVRDARDNCITVCNMENLDPLGVHTGDSIVVAPSQTLNNDEYFRLRETALKVIRHFGVVGECNIQYAVDPNSNDFVVVEVNARLSRSSALASKATGYPLAYVAAKLAMGCDLVQIRNAVTRCTTACFEPSLDYIVTKVPRWDLVKFGDAVQRQLGSCMKSVGEVMAIGRSFEESFQKALRMVEGEGFEPDQRMTLEEVKTELKNPTPRRVWAIARGFDLGMSSEEIHDLSKIDMWFLSKLSHINECSNQLKQMSLSQLTPNIMRHIKLTGFSDGQISHHIKTKATADEVRAKRKSMGVVPNVKQVDTLAAEFPAQTNYLYLTYGGVEDDVEPLAHSIATAAQSLKQRKHFRVADSTARMASFDRSQIDDSPRASQIAKCSTPNKSVGSTHLAMRCAGGSIGPNGIDTGRVVNALGEGGRLGWGSVRESPSTPGSPSAVEDASQWIHTRRDERRPGTGTGEEYTMHPRGIRGLTEQTAFCVLVLGCGCYRIGSSVEFDWIAMSCVKTLRSIGRRAIMVNCNPETVSTDYDESDRLFFEDLSLETVLDIWEFENPGGIIISVGGQAPNNLALDLRRHDVNVLGTSVDSIDTAEDRFKFSRLCDELRIDQPRWSCFTDLKSAVDFCGAVQYPVLVRPSYVLSGAAMKVVNDEAMLADFIQAAAVVSRDHPVVISKYIDSAKEVEMDAIAANGEIVNYAISEHVENAGVHSGDATLILPAQKLYVETIRRVKKISQKLCRRLNISGPFNIQFMCRQNEIKVIECNLRASRTFPFISKTFNTNFIDIATRIMVGVPYRSGDIDLVDLEYVGVKVPCFSFTRLRGSDPCLGVEMRSTGEVACFSFQPHEAFLKAFISSGLKIPKRCVLVSCGPEAAKAEFTPYIRLLLTWGFKVYVTQGTWDFLNAPRDTFWSDSTDLEHETSITNLHIVHKPGDDKAPNALDVIASNEVELLINIPGGVVGLGPDKQSELSAGFLMRRAAIDRGVTVVTDLKIATMLIDSLQKKLLRDRSGRAFWEILSWDEYTLAGQDL
eukprot:GHVN01095964.1.p1 GENE.GHVN01095964.1~~GHVN01095964.1.p1  ORF type:complete len:1692 (+),score=283.44 GHVN01095964.1:73-5076(+)